MSIDVDRFADSAGRLDLGGIDFTNFESRPLDPASLRCLRYMHDVEHHTICHLRDLLVTPAHRDPRITTFLTVWSYEEMWHGEAIGRVLTAHGEQAGPPRVARLRRSLWRPVGAGVMPATEVAFVIRTLLGDDGGRAAIDRIDRLVDRLPGLEGLGLVSGAVARYGRPGAAGGAGRAALAVAAPAGPRPGFVSRGARPAA